MIHQGRNYYYELIYRFDEIHEEDIFRSIAGLKLVGRQIASGQAPFLRLYRKIYPLNAYRSVLADAVVMTLQTEKQLRNIESSVTDSNIRFLKKQLDFVFNRIY